MTLAVAERLSPVAVLTAVTVACGIAAPVEYYTRH
jgi:hypothetical protein